MYKKDTKTQKAILHRELGDRITSNVTAIQEGLLSIETSFKTVGFNDAAHSIARYRVLVNCVAQEFADFRFPK